MANKSFITYPPDYLWCKQTIILFRLSLRASNGSLINRALNFELYGWGSEPTLPQAIGKWQKYQNSSEMWILKGIKKIWIDCKQMLAHKMEIYKVTFEQKQCWEKVAVPTLFVVFEFSCWGFEPTQSMAIRKWRCYQNSSEPLISQRH